MEPDPLHIIIDNIIDMHADAARLHHNLCGHPSTLAIEALREDMSSIRRKLQNIIERRVTIVVSRPATEKNA